MAETTSTGSAFGMAVFICSGAIPASRDHRPANAIGEYQSAPKTTLTTTATRSASQLILTSCMFSSLRRTDVSRSLTPAVVVEQDGDTGDVSRRVRASGTIGRSID